MPRPRSRKSAASGSSQKMQKLPDPPAEPSSFDVIAYKRVEALDEELGAVAKEALRRAMEGAKLGAAGDRNTYGNEEGLYLLEEKDDVKEKLNRLEGRMALFLDKYDAQITDLQGQIADLKDQNVDLKGQIVDLKGQIADLKGENVDLKGQIADLKGQVAVDQVQITDLQGRVKTLTKDAEGYHGIRHRFIDVYRRDHFGGLTEEGERRIRAGNVFAHEGDASADIRLFATGQRNDMDALVDLYGLTVDQMSFLDEANIDNGIATLNIGAGWIARGRANIPEYVVDAFQTFTTELAANLNQSLTDQSLDDDTTTLGRLNQAFSAAHRRGLRQRRLRVAL